MNKIIIYTAIIGGYDLLPRIIPDDNIEYYCFTDSIPENTNGWNCIYLPPFFVDNKLTIGYLKLNPHLLFGSDTVVVWIDSNIDTIELTSKLITVLLKDNPIVTAEHRYRKTVFGEAAIVAEYNLDNRNKVMKWESELKSMGFPDDKGLGELYLLIRDLRNPAVRNFNDTWWRFLLNGSRRDQLSFMPALWHLNLEGKYFQLEDKDSKRTEFLKYSFRAHANPHKRVIENKFPLLNPDEYSPFCWTELRSIERDNNVQEFYLPEPERWTTKTLEGIRELNHLVHQYKIPARENYCYLEKENISRYSTPDLRYAWKRSFLRKAVLPSQRGIEIGFGHGYSTAIMLGYNPLLSIIAIEPTPDQLSYECEKELIRQYDRRLEVYYGRIDQILEELIQKLPLEKIEHVHYNTNPLMKLDEFWQLMEWYLCQASVGCRLIISDMNKEISDAIDLIQSFALLKHKNPGLPDVAGNQQYIKIRQMTKQEYANLYDLYTNTIKKETSFSLVINNQVNRLFVSKTKVEAELNEVSDKYKNLLDYTQRLERYTKKMERPTFYFLIKVRRLINRILNRKSSREDVDSILEKR